jgi:hypothetical protein
LSDSSRNCGHRPHLEEPTSREELCAFTGRIQHAAALSIEDLREAIRLYRDLLLSNPPQELLPSIYCGLGNASYRDGNLVDALVYWELYREYCPEEEESALEAMIAILRKPLS